MDDKNQNQESSEPKNSQESSESNSSQESSESNSSQESSGQEAPQPGSEKVPLIVRFNRWLQAVEEKHVQKEAEDAEKTIRETSERTAKSLKENRTDLKKESIVGNIIAPAEGEYPIRQYHMAKYRYYPRLLFADGRLEVTNMRVIYRVSGNSLFGPVLYHNEYEVKRVSGLNIESGRRISWPRFVISMVFLAPVIYILAEVLIGLILTFLHWLNVPIADFSFPIACAVLCVLFVLAHERKFLKMIIALAALALAVTGLQLFIHLPDFSQVKDIMGFFKVIWDAIVTLGWYLLYLALSLAFGIIGVYNFAMRKDISIQLLSTHAAGTPIEVTNSKSLLLHASTLMVFGPEAQQAVSELGAILHDIHTQGGAFAIKKWSRIAPNDLKRMNKEYRDLVFADVTEGRHHHVIKEFVSNKAEKSMEKHHLQQNPSIAASTLKLGMNTEAAPGTETAAEDKSAQDSISEITASENETAPGSAAAGSAAESAASSEDDMNGSAPEKETSSCLPSVIFLPQKSAPEEDTASETAVPETAVTEDNASEGAVSGTVVSEDTVSEGAAPETAVSEDAASVDAASEDAASEDAASEADASETAVSEDAASETVAPETVAAKDTASEDAVSGTAVPDDAVSEDTASEDTASEAVVSEDTASEAVVSEDTASESAASEETSSDENSSKDSASGSAAYDPVENVIPIINHHRKMTRAKRRMHYKRRLYEDRFRR